ncbi:MAG: response regulator [Promethearchaeota archaeon]
MKRIGILVSEDIKLKWQNYVDKNEFTTISMLIREAVNFYINNRTKIQYLENYSKVSHDLKEPLTVIKGFSQLIIENYTDKIDVDVLLKMKEIFNQSMFLENKINEFLSEIDTELVKYDVLIIDDDSSTIMVLTDFLELKGYTCKGVTSGAKGLEELKRFAPKLILLDIILPDIDGYEVCTSIKSNEELKNIPVFFITAIPYSEASKKLKETRADGILLKPFNFLKFNIVFNYL